MYWIRYILLLFLFIPIRLLTFPLAPIAVLFFSTPDKLSLRFPFRWMMTNDNTLAGDEKWNREHVKGDDPLKDKWRIGWMWRNGGHDIAYGFFGCPRPSSYPQHRSFTPFLGRYIELYLGWSNNEPRGKIVLTVRWRNRTY